MYELLAFGRTLLTSFQHRTAHDQRSVLDRAGATPLHRVLRPQVAAQIAESRPCPCCAQTTAGTVLPAAAHSLLAVVPDPHHVDASHP